MGKLDIEPVIYHFSHQHPLTLLNLEPQISNSVTCSGCKLEASAGWIYNCSTCNYSLHKSCSQLPQNLNHPVDPNHTLILLSSSIYPNGAFKCDACGKISKGFCYHCKECQLDIHTLCAFMPSYIDHIAHNHSLNLFFSPPYHNKGFRCDVCKGTGSNCWLYRCESCEFDVHTSCAMANISPSQVPISETQQKEQHQVVTSRSVPSQFAKPVPNFPQYPNHGNGFSNFYQTFDQVNVPTLAVPYYVQPASRANRLGSDLVEAVIEGAMQGFAQQAGQAMVQGFLGSSS